jgi:carbon-monoxide dehydrogenase medium subunit
MSSDLNYIKADSLSHALDILSADSQDITPLAGGTNVIVNLRQDRRKYKTMLDIKGIKELHGVRVENGHLVVGGATTIAELLRQPLIADHSLPLKTSSALFANPLIRNRATLAGNLVDASPAADTAPPLLVLDAEVELISKGNVRWLALDDFITGVNQTKRQPDELLTSIRWPIRPENCGSAFYKLGLRKADAISVLSVAVRIILDEKGQCASARIALGAVAPRPMRATAAEDLLEGNTLSPELIEEAARLSAQATEPIDDVRGSAVYRRRVTGVVVRRLLISVTNKLLGEE